MNALKICLRGLLLPAVAALIPLAGLGLFGFVLVGGDDSDGHETSQALLAIGPGETGLTGGSWVDTRRASPQAGGTEQTCNALTNDGHFSQYTSDSSPQVSFLTLSQLQSELSQDDGTTVTPLGKDGESQPRLNGSISGCDMHHSCNCFKPCMGMKITADWESWLHDGLEAIIDSYPMCAATCRVALIGCAAALAVPIPLVDDLVACGGALLVCAGCVATGAASLIFDIGMAGFECLGDCYPAFGGCPSDYGYPECSPTEECKGVEPAKRDTRLWCANNAVVRQQEICIECEWKWKTTEVIEVCLPPMYEVCVSGADTVRCVSGDDEEEEHNDHPDDNYDVSTPRVTLDNGSDSETAPDVAILFKGSRISAANLLASFNEPSTFVDIDFSPDWVNAYPVLIIPSGGLYGLDSLPSFKSNLEQYVENGGTLIVFTQQHGYEFNALPGGEVSGFGWLEDQSCHHGSVGIGTYHPVLSGQDSITSDLSVDGYFTSYPDDATILLSRTKNGMPAMLMYDYGEGRVIATTAYTDWAYGRGQATQDGKNLVRDVIAWVKDTQEIPQYGANDALAIPVDVANVHLPIPEVEYPQYELGDVVSISVDVTNYADDQTADKVVFSVFDPDFGTEDIEVPVSIAPGNTAPIGFIYETTESSKGGVYFILYTLYAGETLLGPGFGGAFALGVDTTSLSTYDVNFALADPDKETVRQESVPLYLEPGEVRPVSFTYANRSKLGIWSLEYEVRDYYGTLIDKGVQRFAVSNYAENPDGWVYQGSGLLIWATTPDDHVPVGTEVPFTVYVRNDSDSDFSGNIAVGGHEARHEGGRWWAYYGAITDIAVPAHSEASYMYSHTMDLSTAMYFGLFEEGVPYEDRYFHEEAVATSEKGIWVFHPSIDLGVTREKSLYTSGEYVSLSLNMKNERDATYDVSAVVRVLDPENYKLFEDAFDVTLPGYASDERTFNLSVPADAKYGFYVVTAEARVEGEKVGSGSTYFEVRKGAIVRVSFDHLNKAYRAREGMTLVLEAMNVVSVPWSSAVDVSIPDLHFSDSVDFVLDPGQTEQISYNLSVPADIAVGKHDVTVTTSIDSSAEHYYFVVPESELVLAIDRTSYTAGEDLSISLTNVGGVDTTGDCSIEFRDSHGLLIYEGNSVESVLAGESTALTFTLPDQLVGGSYYLIASCKDLTTDRAAELSKSITVDGLGVALTQVTDKKAYFNDETISVQTEIANLDGEIIDGMLNLKIVRPRSLEEEGWTRNPVNGHYYKLTVPMDWLEAEAKAVEWEGHLVTINDREEELWLRDQFGTQEHFWIGFNDLETEGDWQWVSGEPVTYTNWAEGEPNDYQGIEDAAVMNWAPEPELYGDSWNDLPIHGHQRGIVETSLDSVPQGTAQTYSALSSHSLSPPASMTMFTDSNARAYNFMPDRPVTETTSAPRDGLPRRYDNGPPIRRDDPSGIYQPTRERGSPGYYPDYSSPTYGGPPSEAWPAGYAGVTSLTHGSLPTEAQPTGYASVTSVGNGSISGFVYEEDGVTPIEGATVKAANWDAQPFQFVGEDTTDASGAYVLSGLGAGDYRVLAYATDYEKEFYQDTWSSGEAQPVAVSDGQVTPDIDFSLGPGGTISGTVTSADSGTPLPQVSVYASHADSGGLGAIALTDESGDYTITNLPYDTYFVQSPSSWRYGTGDEHYLTEFWQEKTDWGEADAVTVSEGVNPSGINFTLEVGGSISGVVRDEAGDPIAGASVYASGYDVSAWGNSQTAEDGSYTIHALPSGNYRVYAWAPPDYILEYYDGVYDWSAATLVPVTVPNETSGISFVLEIGGSISGVVKDEAGDPIPGAWVYASEYDNGAWGSSSQTAEDGSYIITGLPSGNYRVQAQAPDYIREYYDDVYDWDAATPVPVTVLSNTPDIDFTLELGGTISGVVKNEAGDPIQWALVYASEYDSDAWGSSQTAEDGSYTITGLPSGNYRVQAQAPDYIREYYDDVYDWDAATPVPVTVPSNTPDIDFTLEVGGTISGVVRDEAGDPISGAWANASEYDHGAWGSGSQTAEDGTYTITGLPSGSYRVQAQASGYIREYYDGTYHEDEATPVSVTAPDDTPGINFALEVGGTISGYVYQEDGVTPIPDVWVYAWDFDTGVGMEGTDTNLDGSYTLDGLPSGGYRVRACPSCNGLDYVSKWYDDTYYENEATPVSVTAPDDTPGINFALEVGGTISGYVYQEDGVTPIRDVHVYAEDYDTGVWMEGTNTGPNGSYSLVLPSGTYLVRACPSCAGLNYVSEWYDGTYHEDEATPVSVTAPNDTPDISFTLELGGSISGYVYQEDGVTPIPDMNVYAVDFDTGAWMETTYTDVDGSYSLVLPSGAYRLGTCPTCSGLPYVREFYDGVYDSDEATPVSVTAPNDTPQINFTLESGGTISGHVYQEDGVTPIHSVYVHAESFETGAWMGDTDTNLDGSYTITGLPTGTYRIRACPSCNDLNYVSEWYDDTYYENEATAVSVTAPNDTPQINFTLESGGTISGHVYQEDGVTPIFNVRVSAEDYDMGEELADTDTNLDGSYTILGLPTGTYRIRACASCSGLDYVDELYDDVYHWEWGLATPVSVTSPNDTPDINFTLGVGGTVSGYVYQQDGVTPIPNVHVFAENYDTGVWAGATNTNLDGSYTISGLPTGTYQVRACPSCNGLNYVSEWYDDTYYEGEAAPVSVTVPNDTPDINFTLESGGTISGHVYQEDGFTPLPNVCIGVADYDTWTWMESTDTNPDGSYSLILPTGTYRVRASGFCSGLNYVSKWYDNTYDGDQATPVFVSAPNDTPNINFTLELGGTISGHVYQEDGETPIPNVHIYAQDYFLGVWMEGTNTGPDGSYSLVLPTGAYQVGACPSCSGLHHAGLNYIREWFDGTYYEPQATLVWVTAPNDTPDINFALEIGGTISGHVYQEDGVTPIRNVHVYAEDYNMGVWMEGTDTNLDGSYSLVLPTGSYRVRACPSCNGLNYFDEWYDSTRNWEEATPVSVTAPDDTAGINFTLVRPLLTLTPSSGSVGALVTVSGSGMTPNSTIPVGGITFAGIPWNEVAIPVDSAGNMTPITLAVPMVGIGPQQVVATDSDGMSAEAIFTVTAVVWETTIPVTLSVSEVKNIVTNISIPSEMPNMTGKFNLLATLYASSSQVIAQSDTYSLFITDTNTSLTLETDKEVYKPNEPITIYGEAQNNAEMAGDFSLSIRKDTEEIFFDSFTLAPGESYSFTTSTTSESSFTLEGILNGLTVTDSVRIEYPNVDVTILGPDMVGLAEFDVGILVENVADVDSDIRLSMADQAWDMVIAPGESRLVETAMSITEDTTLNVIVSGDVEKTAQKEIVMGEGARIDISPQELYLEGPLNIPFSVANTGIMDTEFEATFSVDGQGIVKAFYLPQGESIADALAVDLSRGEYSLEYWSPFEEGSVDIHVAAPELVVVSAPDGMTLMLGQDVTMTFVVENRGGAEGEASLRLTIPGIFEQSKSVFVRPGEQEEISFDFRAPDDLEEKEYKAIYELNGVEDEFSFRVQGLSISVAASLDKALYEEGEIAVLTLTVTNDSDLDLSLYARVQLNEYEELQHFGLANSVSLEFDVPVSFNGHKLFYGIYAESGRALHLDSVYVHKKEAAITLYTDKQVYSTGETVIVFVDTTQSGTLNVVAPGYAAELPIDGSTAVSFTVPGLRSGTYYIDYTFDGFASSYPFDVVGYSARIIEFRLDKESYAAGDSMHMEATVEVNRDVAGLFRISLYGPLGDLIDEFEAVRALAEGENQVETDMVFSTDTSGIHSLVYGVYGDLPGSSLVLLASGAEYFDGTAEADTIPPTTMITPEPLTPDGLAGWYVSPVTVSLAADDNPGGSGVALTEYRLDGDPWQTYAGPFTLLADGTSIVEARSIDNAGNVEEPPAFATFKIDQTAPIVSVEVPGPGVAVQDGITLAASAADGASGVADVRLYVRDDTGGNGTPVGYENLPATYNPTTGNWEYHFDSTALPDGYYVALAKADDNAGNEAWSEVRHFSIRNWAVLELLPASKTNKAGRTMPVKFSLRIAAAVDPAQPFVRNEELTIKIYETGHPEEVLQTSTYGDTARDYRIDEAGELYITNFKTLKKPKDYAVEIWRKDFLVGSFTFDTVK